MRQALLLLLLLLSCFSRVRLCATPETAAHQAPPSLGFSRQEHWSGLPFPSPIHESEKWKWKWSHVRLLATPLTAAYQAPLSMGCSRQEYWSGLPLPSSWCLDCSLLGFSVFRILQARILEWVTISFSKAFSWTRDWIWVSHIPCSFFTNRTTKEAFISWGWVQSLVGELRS